MQLIDDGGLEDVPHDELERMRDAVAAAIVPLTSTRIVLRAVAPPVQAITLVATTSDATAAALGIDDDETIDLWLTFDRSTLGARA